jgi:peptide/nickel transport system substrate-binding protein
LLVNPNEQEPSLPWNPFTDVQIREAMNWLIDRDRIIQDVYGGFAAALLTPFVPSSADYLREPTLFGQLERQYAGDFARAKEIIDQRMVAANASIGSSGFWEDSVGRVIDLVVILRIGDEREEIGNYVAEQLRAIDFNVTAQLLTSSEAIPLVYGGDPSIGNWHIYTEGLSGPTSATWDDGAISDFHNCAFEPFCARFGPPGTYSPPQDFDDDATTLANGLYSSLAERQALIRDLIPRILSETNYRMWLVAEERLFAANDRVERFVVNTLGREPWGRFTMGSAKLLPGEVGVDLETGVGGELHVLNPVAFEGAWNPWAASASLYDRVQQWTFGDPGMWLHPVSGGWIDFRVNTTVETARPLSTIMIPSDAMVYDVLGSRFVLVDAGMTATSKVTTILSNPGTWHTGEGISMDDLLYSLANAYRRILGDIRDCDPTVSVPGRPLGPIENVVAVRVVDEQTIEAYLDFRHVDEAEIAAVGHMYMFAADRQAPVPWEIAEAAAQSCIAGDTAITENVANSYGRIWLDLVWNPRSIEAVDRAFADLQTNITVPRGMEPFITPEEAADRYAAAKDFRDRYEHWYASNGPFLLQKVDVNARGTTMVAFRDGYPFPSSKWDHLLSIRGPDVVFGSFPGSLIGGRGAILPFSTTLDGEPSDPQATRWILRKTGTNLMLLSGVATRMDTGEYAVQLLSTLTHGLESGDHELLVIVTGTSGSEVHAFPLEVTSQFDYLLGLIVDLEADYPLPYREIAASLEVIQGQIEFMRALGITALILTVAAAALGLMLPMLVLKRLR